jgi:hypothetical protein
MFPSVPRERQACDKTAKCERTARSTSMTINVVRGFEVRSDFGESVCADARELSPYLVKVSSVGSKTAERALTHFVIAVRVALTRGVFRLSL